MRLVMISLDAVSGVDADRCFDLPALHALRARGAYCENVRTVYPTITYPIHASLLTGCYPDRHGIAHNQPFQPDTPPDMRAWYWEERNIACKTLHQAAHEKGMDTASILWPVTGKSRFIRRNFPEIAPLPGENATFKMLRYATPVWVLRMEMRYGKTRESIRQPHLDDYAAVLAKALISSRRTPDFLTIHLVDCDAMRHEHGTHSPEAHDAIRRLDRRVGEIIDTLDKRGLLEDTLICVVSDHGQRDAENAVPLDNLLRLGCAARAQTLGMGAYIYGDLDGAKKALEENKRAWRIRHIYDETQLRALHAPMNVHLAVDAEDGACFTDRADEVTRGEHGFSLNQPEAHTLFLLAGRGIREGCEIREMNLVDIAPTLAQAAGLHLPDTDGRVIEELFI